MTTKLPLQEQVKIIKSIIVKVLNRESHRDHYLTKMPSSDVLLVAILAITEYGQNYRLALERCKENKFCDYVIHESQFSRRIGRLEDFINLIISDLERFSEQEIKASPDLNLFQNSYITDTMPVKICENIRIPRVRITKFKDDYGITDKETIEAFRGFIASKRQYFYGVKLSLICNCLGFPKEFELYPGETFDPQCLSFMNLDLGENAELYCDKIYDLDYLEENLKYTENITLKPIRKKTTKKDKSLSAINEISLFRKLIETMFSLYTAILPKKIHAVTITGFLRKVRYSMLGFSFTQFFRLGLQKYLLTS
jgi:hypothetical protein